MIENTYYIGEAGLKNAIQKLADFRKTHLQKLKNGGEQERKTGGTTPF